MLARNAHTTRRGRANRMELWKPGRRITRAPRANEPNTTTHRRQPPRIGMGMMFLPCVRET